MWAVAFGPRRVGACPAARRRSNVGFARGIAHWADPAASQPYHFQSVKSAIDNEGDVYTVIDVLARRVGVRDIFSDWRATLTYYANCVGL